MFRHSRACTRPSVTQAGAPSGARVVRTTVVWMDAPRVTDDCPDGAFLCRELAAMVCTRAGHGMVIKSAGCCGTMCTDRCKTDGKLKPVRDPSCGVDEHGRAHGAVQGCAQDARGCRCRRRRECVADLRDSCAGCGTGTGGNGLHSRCQLSLRMHGLPNRMHGPLQNGWQVETDSRVTLRGRSARRAPRCCARMRSRCTQLSVPATRT